MLIGGDFNKKGKSLLKVLGELSAGKSGVKIAVSELNEELNYDRNELKSILEYLENKECVHIESIGGPFLYGHISITDKGLKKAE